MRLFISNSDRSAGRTLATLRVAIVALLACSIAIIAASEIGVRIFIYQVSKNLSRIHQESMAASQIRGGERRHQQMLLVGNSLLLDDVDIMELNQHLRPERSITRFAIDSTTYYDWYFGIRGLLAVGSRPDIIVLCFDARHIILPGLYNERFAYYLMQKQDLLNIKRTLKLTTADTFDLLLANTSIFYALRKDIRLAVLRLILPELPQLRSMTAFSPKPSADPAVYRTIAKERLIAFRDLATSSNIRFHLLLMPPVKSDSAGALREIGHEISVPVHIPLENDGLDISDYDADRYHLNESGRDKFTKALLPLLQEMDGQDEIQQ
jgi:hypothetical protein